MADPRRSHTSSRSRTGWVWVIVGIVAVGLIVWWIAAAVDDDQGELATGDQEISQLEQEGEQGVFEEEGGQIFDDQAGVFEEEGEQADRSGQVLGEAPGVNEFNQWNEDQQQAQVNQDYVAQGAQQLGRATEGVIVLFEQQPQEGQQVGGGPNQELQQQQQTFQESISQLEQAQEQQQPEAFSQAANNFVSLLQSMKQQAGLDQLDQPVQQLQQTAEQIKADQPLAEQEQQVRLFFNQSSQVLDQMAKNIQATQTGGGPTDQQQNQQDMQQQDMQQPQNQQQQNQQQPNLE